MDTLKCLVITKNPSYDLIVDPYLNCAYLILKGYWDEYCQLGDYVDDVKLAAKKLDDGFKFLVDMSEFRGCKTEYLDMVVKSQKAIVEMGLSKTAEVLPPNHILKTIAESLSKQSGMATVYFNDRVTAEKWLSLY